MATKQISVKIVIPCRFSYMNVFTAKQNKSGALKYSVSCIIPKSDKATIKIIKDAVAEIEADALKTLFRNKLPRDFKRPLSDGDTRDDEDAAYENCWYINASCNNQPGVVDKKRNPILSADEIKSGDYGFVSLTVRAYDNEGKGISCYLNNIMKTKDGEPLGGGSSATADFADIPDEEEDFEDDDLLG